jgi:hypothetical protein
MYRPYHYFQTETLEQNVKIVCICTPLNRTRFYFMHEEVLIYDHLQNNMILLHA